MIVEYFKYFIELAFGFSMFINAMLFVPQAIKIYKTKNANGLSAVTFLGFNAIQLCTILHGYINQDYILMFGTMLGFIFCGTISILIYRYRQCCRSKIGNQL